ncbi:hypothetical protein [Aquirufa rosea]|uniref:hypothetical protein n=1 Tax=Aquirufa rosea TaxID=2509241 RepID=UPI00197B00B3|nr:hypothetical protein [Aquirufa rosea]
MALESHLNADVFSYSGQIVDGLENSILDLIEDLAKDNEKKKDRLIVILTTPGGSAIAVKRYVNIIRQHMMK